MRIILFGLGKKFEEIVNDFADDNIVVLSDNNESLHGQLRHGKLVVSPNEILKYEFDFILITCLYWKDITKQLCDMGVDGSIIYNIMEYPMIRPDCRKIVYRGKGRKNYIGNVLYFAYELAENGGSLAMQGMIEALSGLGIDVDVICNTDGFIRHIFQDNGVNVIYCPQAWYDKGLLNRISGHYSLIIINSLQQYRLIGMLSEINVRLLWWIHEPPYFYESFVNYYNIYNIDNKNLLLCFVSDLCKNIFLRYIKNTSFNTSIIEAGIEDKYNPVENIEIQHPVSFSVIGHVCEEKGQGVLLEAMELLDNNYRNKSQIVLIGNISEDGYGFYIKNRASALQNVKLYGRITTEEVHDLYKENTINVTVCPSRIETLSLSIVEGMMHKKPVIVSSNTGIASYITNGINGYVFNDGNAFELSVVLKRIIDYPDEARMVGERGRLLYESLFSINALIQRIRNKLHFIPKNNMQKREWHFSEVIDEIKICEFSD